MGKGPFLPNLEMLNGLGIDPKTGLPRKMVGGLRCTTKEDYKKLLRKQDEQIFVNRYTWHNLPCNLSSQEVERMLYYYGQLIFWYYPELDEFFLTKFALDGGIDFYSRYRTVHPIPISGGADDKQNKAQEKILSDIKLNCVYGIKMPEDLTEDDLKKSCVIIRDYTNQLPQQIIPTVTLQDAAIDLEAECMPFLRTALLMGTGIRGVRVQDADQSESVRDGARGMTNAALNAEPYVPIEGTIEFQELTNTGVSKSQEYLQSIEALDNMRMGFLGVQNGGIFAKSQYVNNQQTSLNSEGGDVSLTLQDGLKQRQNACLIINSIWGTGTWCEINENLVAADLNGDGLIYETNEGNEGGIDNE